jgi:hypothetical protein
MTMALKNLIFFIIFLLAELFSYGQVSSPKTISPFNNPVILKHYSLTDLQQVSPKKLAAIDYYYTHSFILDSIACNECRLFDKKNFDVSEFEQFRKENERYVREYTKYGYRLTLLSRDEMLYPPVR